MAQANLTVIGNAFASLAQEVPLLSNHPIVGIGAQLTQLGNAQQQMLQQLNQIQQQLATAQRDITRKYVVLALPECQFSNMYRSSEHNAFARHCNGNAASPDAELVPLVNANNQAVPGFPATLGDLRTITGKYTNTFTSVSIR